jgi:hypothetical protein
MIDVVWGGEREPQGSSMRGQRPNERPGLVFTGMTWEGVGLLLRKVAWAGRIRLVVRRGLKRVADVR